MSLFDFLFGTDDGSDLNQEDYRDVSENRRHRAHGSSNWTSREDWDCDPCDHDGHDGFDSYEDNDF